MGGFLTGVDPGIRKTKTPTVNTFVAGVGFTAGSSTTIALTDSPGTEEHLTIFFDGVGQHRSTYSVSGSTVTFDTAIPTGVAEVEATYAPAVYAQLSTVSDNAITTAKILNDAVTVGKLSGGVLTDGFAATEFDLGTNTTGTETLDYTNGNFQRGVNGGAHTLAPQTTTSTIIVQYTNNASAGTLTTSGYTIVTGDALTTTDGHDFMIYSTVLNSFKHLHVVALQ